MSTLSVSNITDGTTTVGTSYVVNGSARILCNYTSVTTTTIRDSMNVSSLTDLGTGQTTVSFTNSMSQTFFHGIYQTNAYGTSTSFDSDISGGLTNRTASNTKAKAYGSSSNYADAFYNDLAAYGDLA